MLLHDEALGYRPYRYDHTEERATGDVDIHIDASVADRLRARLFRRTFESDA